MAGSLIECVPNFSEGREFAKVEAIGGAIASARGVQVLRSEMDADHNRSVVTFAGTSEAVVEGAFRGIAKAAEVIDLRTHTGVHPRIGAADVVPLVPLEGIGLAACAELAHQLGRRVWQELGVPVYFYEAAALSPERRPLENVRRGGFYNPAMTPDLGGPALHCSAGGCVIGARRILVAFNINLKTADVGIARAIARKIRASSGGLPFLKAIGVKLASRDTAQVSMNLTNFEQTPLDRVFEAVRAEAAVHGVEIAGSQLIGLTPRKALGGATAEELMIEDFSEARILENAVASAVDLR